jgi:hypothetical protein
MCGSGAAGLGFAWWGLQTTAGRHAFDEMAGIIPVVAGILGLCLLFVGVVWIVVRSRSH